MESKTGGSLAGGLLILAAIVVLSPFVSPLVTYTIDGNTVYIDIADKGRITQTPHTLHDFTNQPELNVTSYFDEPMEIDIAFGFDTSAAFPTRALLLKPHTKEETRSFTCDPPRWYNYTTDPNHFWCWFDYHEIDNSTGKEVLIGRELVFDHAFDVADPQTNTAYWNETEEHDWIDVSSRFSVEEREYNGKDTWYFVTNVEFQPGETKTLKPTIHVLPGSSGKYDICIKPSSLSLPEARDQEALVCLDPWWNDAWQYKRPINITNNDGSEVITNGHTLNVTFDHASLVSSGKSNANGTDVRILENDASERDSVLCLGSSWDSSSTCLQFNLTSNLAAGGTNTTGFQLYYGNPLAGGRKENLSAIFVIGEDWENDQEHYPWQSIMTGGSCSSTIAGGMLHIDNLDKQQSCLYWIDLAQIGLSSLDGHRVQSWFNYSWDGPEVSGIVFESVSDTNATGWDGPIFAGFRRTYAGSGYSLLYDDDGAGDSTGTNVAANSGDRINQTQIIDGTAEELVINANRATDSMTALGGTMRYFYVVSNQGTGGSGLAGDASIDDVRLMHYHSPEPTIVLGSEQANSGGEEQEAREAIEQGIENALPLAPISTDQQIYLVDQDANHHRGSFDKATRQGNQSWGFNYVASGEAFTDLPSLPPGLNIWENESLTSAEIELQVEGFINETEVSP